MTAETPLKMETENPQPTRTSPAGATHLTPSPGEPPHVRQEKPARGSNWKIFAILGVVLLLVIVLIVRRGKGEAQADTAPAAPPVVGVVKTSYQNLYDVVTIPAEFRPYEEVELHAKVSGYVKQMKVDFGDKVKAGQLLATLEVPELQDQLHSAIALQLKAEVDYTNADLIYSRLQTVNKQHPNLVAQQDLDTAQSKEAAASAEIANAKADVDRYETLANYTRITAPFDGVVTHRYADPGSLIQSGTSSDTQSMPLVRVSDNYHLRLDFPVSVEYVKDIRIGDPVEVRVDSLDEKSFTGKITRFMDRVNEDTRTMIVEIEVANPDLEIVPGMYASVALKVNPHPHALAVPTEAVSSEKNPTVYLIDQNSEIELRPINVGVETPDYYQVVSGLKPGDMVMIGNRTVVKPGQKVEPKLITPPTMP
jgi:RND family efflux transporter MFP subunit